MYDKYITGNTFTALTRLPRNKGLLLSSNSGITASFYVLNDQGNTFTMNVVINGGLNILPMQVHTVSNFPAGITGLYLN